MQYNLPQGDLPAGGCYASKPAPPNWAHSPFFSWHFSRSSEKVVLEQLEWGLIRHEVHHHADMGAGKNNGDAAFFETLSKLLIISCLDYRREAKKSQQR
jgi:hypothetical protein